MTNNKLLRLKLKDICLIGLYNVLYKKQDYNNTINSLISLRHLYENYPDRKFHDGLWIPHTKNGKRHPLWNKGLNLCGKK